MMLEAVWFKNKKEVHRVSPVLNVVCDEDMTDVLEIEIDDGEDWQSCPVNADDFVIRVKKEK